MKNKKFKLIASFTSLVMVLAVMSVGIWAASSASLTTTAKVSFTATGFAGSVAGSMTGHASATDDSHEATINAATATQTLTAWNIGTINLKEGSVTTVKFILTVSAIASGRTVKPTLTVKYGSTAVTSGQTVSGTNLKVTISAGSNSASSITSTVKFEAASWTTSVTASDTFTISLSYATQAAS